MLVPEPVPFAAGPAGTASAGCVWLPGLRAGLGLHSSRRSSGTGCESWQCAQGQREKTLPWFAGARPRPIGPFHWPQPVRAFVYTRGGGGQGRGLWESTLSPTVT